MKDHGNLPKKSNAYLKYSGMAFQLALLIYLGFWLGNVMDKYFGLATPICTISFILLFFVAFMYRLYFSLLQDK